MGSKRKGKTMSTKLAVRLGPATEILEPVKLENAYLCYLASLESPRSRKTQHQTLRRLCRQLWNSEPEAFSWHGLGYAEMVALRSWLSERYAPSTANRILSGVRRVLHHARRLGLMAEGQYAAAVDLRPVRGQRLIPGRALSAGELRSMFAMLNASKPLDARDGALLALLYGAGLRRQEAVTLELEDYDAERSTLRVLGKGNKERLAHLPSGARAAVDAWLLHRGTEPGPLLWPTDHGRQVAPRRMAVDTIRHAIDRLGQRAGVSKFSPHDLRRTYVSDLLGAGADLATVQALVGHSAPTTTARYDRRGEAVRAKAAELIHVPYGEKE
jgi:site-specific recombinase XerD